MLEIKSKGFIEVPKTVKTDLSVIKSLNSVSKIKNVRIRHVKASQIPYIADCNSLDNVILLDSSQSKRNSISSSYVHSIEAKYETESVCVKDNEYDQVTGCRLVGDPLRFEFLTLEKLSSIDASNDTLDGVLVKTDRCSKFELDLNPLSKEDSTLIEKALYDIKNQIPKNDDVAVVAIYNCDEFNKTGSFICGTQMNNQGKIIKTVETMFLGSGKVLNNNLYTIFDIHQPSKSNFSAECEYEIIPAVKSNELDSPAHVSCEFSVVGYWNISSINTIPSHPDDLSHMTVKFVSGWYDRRVYNIEKTYTLHLILYIVENLDKGLSIFKDEENPEIENDVAEWLKSSEACNLIKVDNKELDFTEQLWMKIKGVTSIKSLQNIFKSICQKISTENFKPYVHRNNSSTIATLLRDPLYFKKLHGLLSSWESLQSTKAFVEIGYEYVFREIMYEFDELGLTLEKNGKSLYDDILNEIDIQKKINSTIPFFLALQFSRITLKTICDISAQHLSRLAIALINKYKKMSIKEMFSYCYTFQISHHDGCHFRFYDKAVEPDVWMCKSVSIDPLFCGRKVTNIIKIQKHNDLKMLDEGFSLISGTKEKYLSTEQEEEKLSMYYGTFTTINEIPLTFFDA
uniref:Protein zwilch n=1 Tax=Strongyloides stercoralis TaxID=6248 RepID=A0A0K0EAN3_STRER